MKYRPLDATRATCCSPAPRSHHCRAGDWPVPRVRNTLPRCGVVDQAMTDRLSVRFSLRPSPRPHCPHPHPGTEWWKCSCDVALAGVVSLSGPPHPPDQMRRRGGRRFQNRRGAGATAACHTDPTKGRGSNQAQQNPRYRARDLNAPPHAPQAWQYRHPWSKTIW